MHKDGAQPVSGARLRTLLRRAVIALAAFAMSTSLFARPQAREAGDADAARFLALVQKWGRSQDSFPVYLETSAFERETGASYSGQILATMASEVGLYDTAIERWPLGPGGTRGTPAPPPSDGATVVDAAEAIARVARGRRVVIVNEAHHAAQTRAIFFDLLPRLRQLGFDWYCAETLEEADLARLQRQGYPVRKSGVYSKEPVFGEVLRQAVRLGFSVCAYESDGDTQQARETGQARNLAAVLRAHPDARVLVHAGYGHARKDITVKDARPMAAELERLTGIEPMTVDQTTLGAIASPDRENPAYRPLLGRLPADAHASVVLMAGDTPWSLEPAAYDVSVVLPAPAPSHGRAGWLWTIPGKVAVTGFDADCRAHYPCAIEALHAGEGDDAVPADVVVHERAGAPSPALALFPGDYRIRAVAPDGTQLRETALHVDALSH